MTGHTNTPPQPSNAAALFFMAGWFACLLAMFFLPWPSSLLPLALGIGLVSGFVGIYGGETDEQ